MRHSKLLKVVQMMKNFTFRKVIAKELVYGTMPIFTGTKGNTSLQT